jgi:ATP-dependent DNA helicase RecQ
MLLKTARKGSNAGSQFWSCTGYAAKQCDGTLNVGEQTTPPPTSLSTPREVLEQPRVVLARPVHRNMDTVYFEMLTVSEFSLERLSDAHTAFKPVIGSQWRMSYARPRPTRITLETQLALSVADKLICKGQVTLLGEDLEQALTRQPTTSGSRPIVAPGPMLDSDEERVVWERLLPTILGPSFAIWCTPQVEISTLTADSDFIGSEQRVDFLISHPMLERSVVVEIDGAQHEDDEKRTRHLEANGYQVVRIPVNEIRADAGPKIDVLRHLLSSLTLTNEYADILGNPIRRAGQIQVALLHAIFTGLVSVENGFSVSTDLVDTSELTQDEFSLVISDFSELLNKLGVLYGAGLIGNGISVSSLAGRPRLHIGFFGLQTDGEAILIEDVYLPVPIKWPPRPVKPGRPATFDRELLKYFLRRVFRKPDFRDGQFDIIVRALQAKDTVALLPTGAGKSIAFQLAGVLLPGRTIVIAPIISLIRDQVFNLRSYGISRALGITSDLSGRGQRDLAYDLLKNGEAFFYYIAPERFQMEEFREKLRGMTAAFPVNMVVVDEAHCVSEWGHDFRTAYLRIGQTSRDCSTSADWTPAIVALTGTASRAVLRDLQLELQINDFDAIVTPTSLNRPELDFAVFHEKSDHKGAVLGSYLRNTLPSEFGLTTESFFRRDGLGTYCGLVFCPNVNGSYGVVEVARSLKDGGINAAYYSGTKPKNFPGSDEDWKALKRQSERQFKKNEISILVATKAFGMGIDKANIRFTVHYGIPASIEAYYQEAGRAGRDGNRAVCAVIVSDDRYDKNRQLLAPATSIDEVARFVNETPYAQNDDITRALFFHVKAFQGVKAEMSAISKLHYELLPTGSQGIREVSFGKDDKLTEKALHRLVVVGVVKDYTVDYSSRSFSVVLADATRSSVIEKYCKYVEGYQRGRAEQERKKAEALSNSWDDFVIEIVNLYVQFVYDVIEKGQRRAIGEMLAACQAGSGDELRRRILAYLEQTEYSEAVEAILSDTRFGLEVIANIFAGIISPNDAERLRGAVARSLETYPDHPGLLLLRATTEALSRDGDEQTVIENIEAFLSGSAVAYGLSDSDIAQAIGATIKIVARKNTGASKIIEQLFIRRFHSREALRLLVSEAGLASARVSPWVLLVDVSSKTDSYTTQPD